MNNLPAKLRQNLAGLEMISFARPEEHEEIDRLILDAYAHDYGPGERGDSMRFARVRAEQFDVWAARDHEGAILGSVTTRRVGGRALHEDTNDGELDLRLLGVSPRARRQGIGAKIMRAVTSYAQQEGFGAVVLKTAPHMTGAHRLYESLGFDRAEDRDGLWINGERVLDLYSYVYPLESAARG